MIVLIPFYRALKDSFESVDHHGMLCSCLERISTIEEVTQIYVVTDDHYIELPTSVADCVIVKSDSRPEIANVQETTPSSDSRALSVLADTLGTRRVSVIVLDYRANNCAEQEIREAIDRLSNSQPDDRVVSVHTMRNNVCRFMSYQQISEVDGIFLHGSTCSKSHVVRSRPFFFSWSSYGVGQNNEACFFDGYPWRKLFADSEGTQPSSVRWERLTTESARIHFPSSMVSSDACGTSPLGSAISLKRTSQAGEYILNLSKSPLAATSVLWVLPFDASGFIPGSKQAINDIKCRETVKIKLSEGASGCVLFGMNPVVSGTFHYEKGFPSVKGLFDWKNGKAINLQTGKEIHGRQAFPPIYRVNGTLMAGQIETLLEKGHDLEGAIPIILERDNTAIATESIDGFSSCSSLNNSMFAADRSQGREKKGIPTVLNKHVDSPDLCQSRMQFIFKLLVNGFGDSASFRKDEDFMEISSLQRTVMTESTIKHIKTVNQKVDEAYSAGLEAFGAGRYEESLHHWEQVLRYRPGHQGVMRYLEELEGFIGNPVHNQLAPCQNG